MEKLLKIVHDINQHFKTSKSRNDGQSLILIDRVHLIEKDKLVGFVLDCQFVSMIRVVFKNMLDKEN
ncbi:hypothetical protein C5167_018892 [Papaver somniferum]|uniref:Uncharacterized protein n=1 Tax=Papaver somniferum TaxID=3469 RepID=A0A4Y7IP56_PAPSO|nr:hypothetical protein C5167_018895 [Papaver somniferum]RZC50457.1 hypothetical protein C5167_018892 [Papaver somniferum]